MGEQLVGRLDLVELEVVRHHRRKIDPTRGDDIHETAHAFLPAGAERGHDPDDAQAG
jgi:hypothetical protein